MKNQKANKKTNHKINHRISILLLCVTCSLILAACMGDNTYKLAKKMHIYDLKQTGYSETLKMAQKGHYDANCEDCFKGMDTSNISLFAYACKVDFEIAKAIYANGADIESSNPDFYETPLLAALDGNRNNTEIVYWLIDEGADINVVSYDKCSVFQYLRFWDDTEENRDLVKYFEDHCDMKNLETNTESTQLGKWDEMWDENGEFVFYR